MTPNAPGDIGDPVAVFHSRLRDLHLAAGKPSARVLERKTGYGSTTCNDVLRGARFPSWEVTEALVSVLGGDVLDWRSRWQEARRALDQPAEGGSAPPDPGATPTGSPAGVPAQRSWRRHWVALVSLAGGVLVTAVLLAVVLPVVAHRPSGPPAEPSCATVRRYTVEEQGRLLDAVGHEVGEVMPGDVVDAGELDRGPYHSRRKVTVLSTGKEGYVDQAKLHFVALICRTAS
jgi:hypothetical protein